LTSPHLSKDSVQEEFPHFKYDAEKEIKAVKESASSNQFAEKLDKGC
jgi:hypothetical protein